MHCQSCGLDNPPEARFCMRCGRWLLPPVAPDEPDSEEPTPSSIPPDEPGWERWSIKSRYYDPGLLAFIGHEEGWYVNVSPSMARRYFGGDTSVAEDTLVRVMKQKGMDWEHIGSVDTAEEERLLLFRRRINRKG